MPEPRSLWQIRTVPPLGFSRQIKLERIEGARRGEDLSLRSRWQEDSKCHFERFARNLSPVCSLPYF